MKISAQAPLAYALALNDAGVSGDLRLDGRGGRTFGLRPAADPVASE